MKILSLFNGISGLHLACDKAGIDVDVCYYSEIDKYANKVTEHHYPNDIALGDVIKWREWDIDWASIDLVGAGFPCQAWSVAGQQLGDKDERGMLFWTTLEIIKHVLYFNPKAKFLMENVKMKKDFEQYITRHTEQALGHVEKTLINSALVSAQNRQRYYWTNFEVTQPDDKGVLLRDIIEDLPLNESMPENVEFKENYAQWDINNRGNKSQDQRAYYVDGKHGTLPANGGGSKVKVCGGAIRGRYLVDGKRQDHKMKTAGLTEQRLEVRKDGKTNTLTTVQKDNMVVLKNESATKNNKSYSLTASYGGAVAWNSCQKKQRTMIPVAESTDENPNQYNGILYRKLTPLECERLQTLPEIKKSAIIEFSEKHGKIEWLLEHQRTNVSVGAKYRKLQSSALSAEEKELNQCASAAMSCLSISQADQEMPVQKNVHIILGEGQLQLNYQGDQVLHVNIVELLKKQVHPALEENTAQEIAGINLILEKILLNGKEESQAKVKNSTHQNDGKKNVEKYGKEITHHARDVESNVELDQTDMFITSAHGQNLKTLDLNLQTLFYSVSSVIDLFTLEKIQKGSLLKIRIEYSCGFTSVLSNTQRYKSIGNGWTINVIAHILKHI